MATFAYVGKNREGKLLKGQMSAKNESDAQAKLRSQGIQPTSLQKKGSILDMELPGMAPKATTKDVVIYTRQFSTMIDAGLPLVQCLEILGAQTENKTLAKTITDCRLDVEAGSTYADALRKHPKVFDELYCNMVAAGEAGGILDVIQQRLAAHMEKAIKLAKKIKGAMVYPGVVIAVACIVMTVLMVFVIPIFAQMFTDFGGTLPAPTQLVMDMSDFMVGNIGKIIVAFGALIWGYKRFYKTKFGRKQMDALFLKLPIFGDLIRKAAVAKFTRTLGTLISSGVPILDGLDIVASTAGNKIVEEAILKAKTSISEGEDVAGPLEESGVFPKMVTQMIAVGEATGAMDTMLSKIADFYDDEVDDAVGALTAALEPMLMVFLGVSVGFIVVAMYLPIFEMAAAVG